MRISLSLVAVAGSLVISLAGCTDNSRTVTGYAIDSTYHDDIVACSSKHACIQLCVDVLKLQPEEVDRAKILTLDHYGARFACLIASDAMGDVTGGVIDDSIGWDDSDDSCDDGSCDDSCDDGSCDDGGDDGSMNDGGDDGGGDSGDDGGDGGGGDDGGGDGGGGDGTVIHGGSATHHVAPRPHAL